MIPDSQALVEQMQAFEYGRSVWRTTRQNETLSKTARSARESVGDITGKLMFSDTFMISKHVCSLVEEAAGDVSDIPYSAAHFPCSAGFLYLEDMIGKVRAISWHTFGNRDECGIDLGDNYGLCGICGKRHANVLILAFFEYLENGILFPQYYCATAMGDIVHVKDDKALMPGVFEWSYNLCSQDYLLKYTRALLYFIRSRITITSLKVPDRSTRRRAGRENFTEKPINRVELRVVDYKYPNGNGNVDVEWSCRWIVRGHWRIQYYPSKKMYDLIWIMPFIKGPGDKPLKRPGAKVFSVVR
jgi:hypothetical protein